MQIHLNLAVENEHIPVVERYIQTVKETVQAIYNTLPFTCYPNWLIVEMVDAAIFWLNSLPLSNGVSTTMSPRTVITGQVIKYEQHCQLEFGTYIQVHESHDDSMLPRMLGALVLCPSDNAQGGIIF